MDMNKINEIKSSGRMLSPELREAKFNIIMELKGEGLTYKEIGSIFDRSGSAIKTFVYDFKNPEKNRESSRKWREENPEKSRESSRKWVRENPEKSRESSRISMYKRGVRIADNYNMYDDLSESDKRFIDYRNDTLRIKETGLQYLRLKLAPAGYERHHIIPYKTCIHYWKLTGDNYYCDLTYDDGNIYHLTPEDHRKLHSKLSKFDYGSKSIVPEEDWEEYRELVLNLIEDKNQSSLDDF